MSMEAMSWARSQRVGYPLAKFILITIADNSGTDSLVSANPAHLATLTEAPRAEVVAALMHLVSAGFLKPTGGEFEYRLAAPFLDEPGLPQMVRTLAKTRPLRCEYCGDEEGPFEADHIHPKSRGGSDAEWNRAIACSDCNRSKGARTPEEWMGRKS